MRGSMFRQRGIDNLTMSPTLYNRAGNLREHRVASARLRAMIKTQIQAAKMKKMDIVHKMSRNG